MCVECTINDCNKKVRARGYCGMHYERWRRHGDPCAKGYTVKGLEARRKSFTEVRKLSPSHQKKGKLIPIVCGQCLESFYVIPCRSTRKYCSDICRIDSRRGTTISLAQKQAISTAQKKRFQENPQSNPFYGRTPTNYNGWGHGGYVEELGFSVRSTWERDYLIALKNADVQYEYEPIRFVLEENLGTYCPDLRLNNRDIYVEITGWDKPIKKIKRDMFTKIYNYPLYVWDKKPTEVHIAEFVAMCKGVSQNIEC